MTLDYLPYFFWDTPWKIDMEAKNHPVEKESHFPDLHLHGVHVDFLECAKIFCLNW